MSNSQTIQEIKTATISNSQTIQELKDGSMDSKQFTHQEHVQAITTLRSRRQADNQVAMPKEATEAAKDEENHEKPEKDLGPDSIVPIAKKSPQKFVPKAPFPERLTAPKKGSKFDDILEVFKQVQINIPFLDAIQQVPSYAKFLKDLVTIKRRTNVPKKAFLTEQCDLLPYSFYVQLGLGEIKPTSVTLQLADRSVKVPRGIIEDVLIKVDKFYYPVDFIVLDTEPVMNVEIQILVILGRPFLATANALINCRTGVMKLSFGNMIVELNIFDISRQPFDYERARSAYATEEIVEEIVNEPIVED
ncbi:uncharacterized protein LOC133863232 [Alnus glutinosa]|uniref:uncharacterized protein LOC133863232 n=1 Tax=Alnus glutinosa TaxID=3517 RepID=UPI002D787F2A|nr:uncharacterized protein LOC133863232 [Alnus glutinosa]